ncbi:DUF4360 domain-containing protein [Streptomyces sp. MUM 203J]|uniref:DUF4360 domain-containing protein n=1 Tax=Streptomyces sp. MUM 203J TaxID=2791990 RepID=UPI001F04ADFE|nr:DUF4360 domain-containing protein [Streptomyces sp. MUM 203J]MCH0542962.1 DUF4360 domain-containing protein [Streptomyces sp. MUM 203J]
MSQSTNTSRRNRRGLTLASTGGVALLAAALLSPTADAAPSDASGIVAPPDKIVIEVATVNGSGCPAGTAAVAVAPDNTAFTVTYSEYLAQVGLGSKPTDFRKNCQLNLIVHVPHGFTYAVASADYRGFAHLEKGASAIQKASYYFQGSPDTAAATHRFYGALDDNWRVTDETEWGQLVWAPCGVKRNFNINTELRVSAGTSDPRKTNSFITMDSTDGDIKTIYNLAWKECKR